MANNARLPLLGLLVSVALALVKLFSGLIGHSYALIADAVESIADIFASMVVWGGVMIAARPPDDDHPYGHGKAEPLAALVVALMLIAAGAGIAIQSIREILVPHHGPAPFTLWVLLGVVAVKEILFRIVHRAGARSGSSALLADAWHHRSDAITSFVAAVGISIALIGGERYASADGWAALVASGVILFNAWRLLMPPLHELMDADQQDVTERARAVAAGVAGILDVEKVTARKAGTGYWADMHIEVDPDMSVRDAHELAHRVKDAVMAAMPAVRDVLVHIEPPRQIPPEP